MPVNILMTGGGAPGAAGILRCLKQQPGFTVFVADADEQVGGRYHNNHFSPIPKGDDPSFADSLLSLCRRLNIHVLLPLVTKELLPLAQRKAEFDMAGVKVLVSSAAALEIANNKSRLYEFLQWRGLEVPAFKVVETVPQFTEAVKELGYPGKAVCFKPSVSNGSRGFRIISDSINEHELLFNQKPNNTYIQLANAERILSSAPFPELLVSEYLPGEEYSVDCLARHGEAILVVPRLRRKMINGITVEGEFIQNEAIIATSTRIIKELQLHGNTGIQLKGNAKGEYMVLEINPRVQGTISAGLGAGINLPVMAIKQELELPVSGDELNVKWGTRFCRYWDEVFWNDGN